MAVKSSDILIFTDQFASMLRSHLPLIDVLENLAKETPGQELREVIEDISDDVSSGFDFGDSLANHPKLFDDVFVNVVRAGMLSGRLAESLTQVSEYLTKNDNISRKLRGALSYPIFMGVAFFGVFNAMVFFILPRFSSLFSSFGKELPAPTQILLSIGSFWGDNWYIILSVFATVSFAWMIWLATEEGLYIWDRFKLKLPMVGRLWRLAALSRFLRTFSVQLQNEVQLLDALRLAAYSAGNKYVEESLLYIADDVERGAGITESFQEYDIFSGIVLQMISAGEKAGSLNELLMSAANYFERVLNNEIDVVTGLINPILTVVIGLAIAGMMVASFLPVFDMGNAVQ